MTTPLTQPATPRALASRLPGSHPLLPDVFTQRHRWLRCVLALHVVTVPAVVLAAGHAAPVALGAAAMLLAALATATRSSRRAVASGSVAAGLGGASVLLVLLAPPGAAAPCHVFLLLPLVALYEAWAPLALLVATGIGAHVVLGSSYGQHFAAAHAALYLVTAATTVVGWRLAEQARTEHRDLLAELARHAGRDPLTGLLSRTTLRAVVADHLAERPDEGLALLVVDLDRFREVNDTLGHAHGDDLLRQVAGRMDAALRDGDLLARVGGDSFAVLVRDADEEVARSVADRLRGCLTGGIVVDGVLVDVDASAGAALLATVPTPAQTQDADPGAVLELLLRQADVAMHTAKETGTGVAVYDAGVDGYSSQRLSTLADLRQAVAACDQLLCLYQPKVDLRSGRVVGVEALVRWQHPVRGLLGPASFVPLADGTALAGPMTAAVLEIALAQAARWRAGGDELQVAVNVSPRCLGAAGFAEQVEDALVRHDVPARLLRLEITEESLLVDPSSAAVVLTRLRAAGVRVSLDDFGTGCSSLSFLRTLPVDELKVDRSFVAGLAAADPAARRADEVLVRAVVDLGHGLGMDVIAEGIETVDVLDAVVTTGCDLAQGFLLARPVTAVEVSELLGRNLLPARARTPLPGPRRHSE